MRKAVVFVFLAFLFLFSQPAFSARNIHITSDKSTLSLDEELSISASASGFLDGEKIYLKGAFHKEGSSNYFGYTKFNSSWIKNSTTSTSQKEVVIGNWDNSVVVKLDYEDNGFTGVGDYKFKLGFYYLTISGNTSSVNWSENSLDIKIDKEPSPTPKPKAVTSNSASITQAETVNAPTPMLSQAKALAVTGKISPKSVKIADVKKEASMYAKIKPIESVNNKASSVEAKILSAKETIFPPVYLLSGASILIVAGIMFLKRELKGRKIL